MPNSTVSRAPLVVVADNKTKKFGEANPVLTVTYSGFVNNEGAAQLITLPLIATTAVTSSSAGDYPITAGGAVAANYTFTYTDGTLDHCGCWFCSRLSQRLYP